MWKTTRYAGRWAWVAALALLGFAPSVAAQQGLPVAEGDRVRIFPAPAVPPDWPDSTLVGRLVGLGPDSLQLRAHFTLHAVPRSTIARIERSIGHPRALRDAGLAFLGTALVGTTLNWLASRGSSGGDFGSGFAFAVGEFVLVLPASVLGGVIGGLTAPERFEPAVLPPPPSPR